MKSRSYDVLSKHVPDGWRDDPDNINRKCLALHYWLGPRQQNNHRKSICGKNMIHAPRFDKGKTAVVNSPQKSLLCPRAMHRSFLCFLFFGRLLAFSWIMHLEELVSVLSVNNPGAQLSWKRRGGHVPAARKRRRCLAG